MRNHNPVRAGISTVAALAMVFVLALPVQAKDDENPQKSRAELIQIGLTQDEAALAELTPAELTEFVQLSQVDPSKSISRTTRTFTVNGEPANSAQASELDRAFGEPSIGAPDAAAITATLSPQLAVAAICYYADSIRYGRNFAGAILYGYGINIEWCMSGSTVISTRIISAWQSVYWAGWDALGVVNKASMVLYNQGRNFAQYKFQLSILFGFGVLQTTTPCIQLNGITSRLVGVSSRCGLL